MKYQLKRAIELTGGEPIFELTLRERLSAGDLRGIKLAALGDLGEMKTEDMLKIIGRLSGRTEPEMNALAPEDLGEIVMLVQGFFSPGLSATKSASESSTSTPPSQS
jgi:hypothetical protein